MAHDRHEIQVGIAIVVAIAVLLFGLLWFQDYRFSAAHREVAARFPSAGGLGVGDPVHVRGIPMGKVDAVELNGSGVLVKMSIDRNVPLTSATSFSVGSQGLVGERLIEMEPGQGRPLADEELPIFDGRYELALSEMAGMFDQLNRRVGDFLETVDGLLQGIEAQGGLGPLLEETTKAARSAAKMMEENAANVRSATRDMAGVGSDLRQFMDAHGENLGRGVDGLATSATKLDSLLVQLGEIAEGTQKMIAALESQQGAAGKLIYDEEMGAQLEQSIDKLRFLIEDIQRNPQRYLTVKIF